MHLVKRIGCCSAVPQLSPSRSSRYRWDVAAHDQAIGVLADAGHRSADTFGGLLPCGATARSDETIVVALALEHHTDGFAVALLILSGAPGQLAWLASEGLSVVDDLGKAYPVQLINQVTGLGALSATVWIDAPAPPQARVIRLSVTQIQRVAGTRDGAGGLRSLSGGPWQLELPLLPAGTIASVPPMGGDVLGASAARRIPPRSWSALRSVVPIGQSRVREGATISLWALERYEERDILTLSVLVDPPFVATPDEIGEEIVLWDDLGAKYSCRTANALAGARWSETVIEVIPPVDPEARRIGIQIGSLPIIDADGAPVGLGPVTFGVALPSER